MHNTNYIEKKIEKRRKTISILITTFLYITFGLIFSFFNINTKREENIIVTVRLIDKEPEIINDKITKAKNIASSKEKQEITKKDIKESETKKEEKVVKNIEIETKEKEIDNKKIFEDYERIKSDERKKIEETFFSDTKKREEKKSEKNELDNILDAFDKKDNTISDTKNQQSDSYSRNQLTKSDTLSWEDGRARRLIYKTDIVIPEQFKKEGLITTLVLKLIVSETGLVTDISIDKSSGFNILDYNIKEQIKRWKFEEANLKNIAILTLVISY